MAAVFLVREAHQREMAVIVVAQRLVPLRAERLLLGRRRPGRQRPGEPLVAGPVVGRLFRIRAAIDGLAERLVVESLVLGRLTPLADVLFADVLLRVVGKGFRAWSAIGPRYRA
jgi:hypothetical protein